MKLPKLNGLLSTKKDIKTVSKMRGNIQKDLDNIRERITLLANEWDEIYFQPLNKADALKKDLLAIDNLHLALKDSLKSNILERHNSVFANPRKDQYYINGAYEILLNSKQASKRVNITLRLLLTFSKALIKHWFYLMLMKLKKL